MKKFRNIVIAIAVVLVFCGCNKYEKAVPTYEYTVTRSNGNSVVVQGDFIDSQYNNFSVITSRGTIVFEAPNASVSKVEIKPLNLGSGTDGLN